MITPEYNNYMILQFVGLHRPVEKRLKMPAVMPSGMQLSYQNPLRRRLNSTGLYPCLYFKSAVLTVKRGTFDKFPCKKHLFSKRTGSFVPDVHQ
jgi:hypothetical protein